MTKVTKLDQKNSTIGFKEIAVVFLLFALACTATGLSATDRVGFPPGYVGGTLLANGDVHGGHPSEEVMEQNRIAAGILHKQPSCIWSYELQEV